MLIIPITGKISWRNPPVITIGLILINCLVYFIFQYGDRDLYYEAELYYFTSGLAKIEMPRYMAYLDVPQPGFWPRIISKWKKIIISCKNFATMK